jgi:hypothetical protein
MGFVAFSEVLLRLYRGSPGIGVKASFTSPEIPKFLDLPDRVGFYKRSPAQG